MKPEAKEALAVVDACRAKLMAAATNDQVRAKLGNLNEVCRVLVVDAEQRPTVPEVVRRYAARFVAREQSLAEQSLRVRPISHDARPSLRTRIMTAAA